MSSVVVSIIIPTFNRRELLHQALISVQNQTFKNWEVLVVDDGSCDGTEEMVLQMNQVDTRIQYVKRKNSRAGASVCRNEGTALSKGDFLIYFDSDDYLSPKALENRLIEMEKHPDLDFGVFACIPFQNQPGDMRLLWNIDIGISDIDRFLVIDIPWQTASSTWRRTAIAKIGKWNDALPSWQDWEYHLRALIAGLQYRKFSRPDFFCRISTPRKSTLSELFSTKKPTQISRNSIPENKLVEYEKLFLQMEHLLIESNQLTNQRKDYFVGLYYWLAQTWKARGNTDEALRTWNLCFDKSLITDEVYSQGRLYLSHIANIPLMRQWWRKRYIINRWPKKFTGAWAGSKYLNKIVLPEHVSVEELIEITR